MQFDLRVCGPGDETAVSLIGQATILETYAGIAQGADLYTYVTDELSVQRFQRVLADELARTWVVETVAGRCAVGYALALSTNQGVPWLTSELQRLYVLYRFHGLGLGKRLMDAFLAHAREHGTRTVTLRVNSKNKNAIRFYEDYGFTIVSEEPFHAGARDYHVLVMELAL